MTFIYAGKFQRFIVFLIDFVLLSIIASFIYRVISNAAGIGSAATDSYYQLMLMELLNSVQGGGNQANISYYMEQYMSHVMMDRLLNLIIFGVLVAGLLVILPTFWKGQTLGRFLCHLTLFNKEGKPATAKNFILRELVGTVIFYSLFGFIGIVITLIMLLVKNRSLVDVISGTHLCFQPEYLERRGINPNNINPHNAYNQSNNYNNDNNIEADWHEVNNQASEPKEEEKNDSDNGDKYTII